jgi:hypothetical protein
MSGMLKALQWVIDLLAWGGHRAKYASTARGPAGRAPLYRHGSRRGIASARAAPTGSWLRRERWGAFGFARANHRAGFR